MFYQIENIKGSYFIGICDNCLGQGETTSGKLIFGRNVFVETERDHTDYTTQSTRINLADDSLTRRGRLAL